MSCRSFFQPHTQVVDHPQLTCFLPQGGNMGILYPWVGDKGDPCDLCIILHGVGARHVHPVLLEECQGCCEGVAGCWTLPVGCSQDGRSLG